MFSDAYKKASEFTKPVLTFIRYFNGTVACACGAYVVINEEGWIITVAHLWIPHFMAQRHAKEITTYNNKVQSIQADRTLTAAKKRKKIRRQKMDPKWITHTAMWWKNARLNNVKLFKPGDLAIGQLVPFDQKTVKSYPVFKKPSDLDPGTGLCRLGYPLYGIKASFDANTGTFDVAPGTMPLPRFPIEGILTRHIDVQTPKKTRYPVRFIETSSPGLKGQSGGPLFDVKGTVWAIQSKTTTMYLGFKGKVMRNGQDKEEEQFINLGWGVHPELITTFLKDNNIAFRQSSY